MELSTPSGVKFEMTMKERPDYVDVWGLKLAYTFKSGRRVQFYVKFRTRLIPKEDMTHLADYINNVIDMFS